MSPAETTGAGPGASTGAAASSGGSTATAPIPAPTGSPSVDAPLDVVGVGLGPFNLGLAALLDGVPGARAVFLEQRDAFAWHPGLLLDEAEIQVPFLADLVTLADPTSRHSFLNYLHEHGRLYRFYFQEQFHLLRREFQAYCAWVSERVESCRFGRRVVAVDERADGTWTVRAETADGAVEEHHARHVVLGVGATPLVPECATPHLADDAPVDRPASADGTLVHSSSYVHRRAGLLAAPSVAVVGSGQSAAEVFLDLLENAAETTRIDWFTRSRGFLAMEYSKLGLEHFSPEYTDHFRGLPEHRRDALRAEQDLLYKGISDDTSSRIHDVLYRRTVDGAEPHVSYRARTELRDLHRTETGWRLDVSHLDEGRSALLDAAAVVLATGYAPTPLPLGAAIAAFATDALGRPLVTRDYRLERADGRPSTVFVQNAELHTHGVGTPDLGLGAHRNAVIVNAVLGREAYAVRERNVFQRFGLGDLLGDGSGGDVSPATRPATGDGAPGATDATPGGPA